VAFSLFNILLDIAIFISSFYFKFYKGDAMLIAVLWIGIGNSVLNIVASAFVIYGHFKRNPGYYFPYVMINVSQSDGRLFEIFYIIF
jgi:hypothetical protein